MKAILAVNNLGFIGLKGGLPWRSSEDFKHFKRMTLGKRLLVGHNTFHTLPHLGDRVVVLDERPTLEVNDIDWCIGGKKTYKKYAHLITELHISHINDNSLGDTTFPVFSKLNPSCVIFNYYFKVNTPKS